jgi:hypothetical protein
MSGLSAEESKQKLADHERQTRKYQLILLGFALVMGSICFALYSHHYIIWDGNTTTAVVNDASVVSIAKDPPYLLVRYRYIVEGQVFERMENYYDIPDYKVGDMLHIEYSTAEPNKHNILGLAYRDGNSYPLP